MTQSVLQVLGLPSGFGYVLLVLCLVLTVAPWLHGHDFGILKIPEFSAPQRSALKRIGPMAMFLAVALHLPFLAVAPETQAIAEAQPAAARTETPPFGNDFPVEAQDAETSPSGLSDGRHYLAEHDDSGCLYPVRILSRDGSSATVHFEFDERVVIPMERVFAQTHPEAEIGARAFAKLPARDAWIPVTVRDARSDRLQVTRDDTAACAPEFGKATKWMPRSEVIDIAPLGEES